MLDTKINWRIIKKYCNEDIVCANIYAIIWDFITEEDDSHNFAENVQLKDCIACWGLKGCIACDKKFLLF